MRMPMLLPKKERGSADYIRQIMYPAMQRFFRGKLSTKLDDATIVFRHVYSEDRPERRLRDHDNIETNMVSDIICVFALIDDGPKYCSHLYMSAAGNDERTEVYVVPNDQLCDFIHREKLMGKEAEKLYET